MLKRLAQAHTMSPEELVGEIKVPKGVDLINADAGGIGIVLFISRMITLGTGIAGIWVLINLMMAAYAYFTGGGKSDTHAKVRDNLTMSVIGLLLIIGSYTVATVIGLVFYNDPTYIITPKIDQIGP